MKRVLILGCPCAGKSTLAREMERRTGLPLIHLDKMYWQPGWSKPAQEEWDGQLAEVLARPQWILDGNYGRTIALRLEAADTAIVLDLPLRICLWRWLKRSVVGWGSTRPDMAEGCRERLDREFLRYVWNFRRDQRPKLMEDLGRFRGRTVLLSSTEDVRECLRVLSRQKIAGD